jgi:hypothetical protein
MTRLAFQIIKCPKCGIENRIVYYASICTFLDLNGSLISRLLNGTLNTSKCENCGVGIRLSGDVLINGPQNMFYLNPADDLEHKEKQLKANGIMSEKGVSDLESMFLNAKKKLNLEKEYQPSPRPPPAPKITPNTDYYNKVFEEISKRLSKNKSSEKDKKSKNCTKNPESPPPPPPPPPKES